MILRSFLLTLSQIGDARFRRVLLTGLGLTVLLLALACWLVLWLVGLLVGPDPSLPWIGRVAWLDDALGWSSLLVMLALSVVLMIPVASALSSFFLDDVARAVEERHYPGLPPAQPTPWRDALLDALGFLGLLIVANLVGLVAWAAIPPIAPFVFYGVNGFLLGREYFTLAAMRRVGRQGARDMRARHAPTIWAAGVLMALPLSVPLMNLVIPILGAATFTHLFHALARTGRG